MNEQNNTAATGDWSESNLRRETVSSANLGYSDIANEHIGIKKSTPVYNDSNANILSTGDNNKIREINIREVNRGFIVSAGCHTFAISTASELINLLTVYIDNPNETERLWFSGKLVQR